MAQHEVFKRIKKGIGYFLNLRVIREKQWQFLAKHQHARRHQRYKIPSIVNTLGEMRDIFFLRLFNRSEVSKFKFGHAAATFLLRDCHGNIVAL